MAKPKIQLDAKTGKELSGYLEARVAADAFRKNLVGYVAWNNRWLSEAEKNVGWDQWQNSIKTLKEIDKKLGNLVPYDWQIEEGALPKEGWADAVYELRQWVLREITPEGWTRILAARRKEAQAQKNKYGRSSGTQILTTRRAAYSLLKIAEAHSIDRSEMLDKLAVWFEDTKSGNDAFALFASMNKLVKPEK
jgi:hypothetical protein